jgi:hypothetical protein
VRRGRTEAVGYLYASVPVGVFAKRYPLYEQADELLALVERFGRVLLDLLGALAEPQVEPGDGGIGNPHALAPLG